MPARAITEVRWFVRMNWAFRACGASLAGATDVASEDRGVFTPR